MLKRICLKPSLQALTWVRGRAHPQELLEVALQLTLRLRCGAPCAPGSRQRALHGAWWRTSRYATLAMFCPGMRAMYCVDSIAAHALPAALCG